MSALKLPSFFRGREVKQFEFRPRYYDPEKEKREQRNAEIRREVEQEQTASDPEVFRSKLRARWERTSSRKQKGYSVSVIRLAIIIALLAWVSYYVLQ